MEDPPLFPNNFLNVKIIPLSPSTIAFHLNTEKVFVSILVQKIIE
jgi:hypothetical protein